MKNRRSFDVRRNFAAAFVLLAAAMLGGGCSTTSPDSDQTISETVKMADDLKSPARSFYEGSFVENSERLGRVLVSADAVFEVDLNWKRIKRSGSPASPDLPIERVGELLTNAPFGKKRLAVITIPHYGAPILPDVPGSTEILLDLVAELRKAQFAEIRVFARVNGAFLAEAFEHGLPTKQEAVSERKRISIWSNEVIKWHPELQEPSDPQSH